MKMPRAGTLNPDRMLESSEEFKNTQSNFTSGSGVRNLPDDAGDTGSIPAPGGFHRLWGGKAQALQLPSPHSRARSLQLRSPHATMTEVCTPKACDPQQEKPLQ